RAPGHRRWPPPRRRGAGGSPMPRLAAWPPASLPWCAWLLLVRTSGLTVVLLAVYLVDTLYLDATPLCHRSAGRLRGALSRAGRPAGRHRHDPLGQRLAPLHAL